MKILDTDFLIAILKKNPQVSELLIQLEDSKDRTTTTIFNAEELLYGALLTKSKKENHEITAEFISQFDILPYDILAMEETVKIKAYLKEKGERIGTTNERIAGIAIRNNASIVTRNTKHFSKIPHLKLQEW